MATLTYSRSPTPEAESQSLATVQLVSMLTGPGRPLARWLDAHDILVLEIQEPRGQHGRPPGAKADGPVLLHIDEAGPTATAVISRLLNRFPDTAVMVACEVDDELACLDALDLGVHGYLRGSDLDPPGLWRELNRAVARQQGGQRFNQVAAELAEANAELSDFAHIIAHDLRAPVRAAHLFGERLVAKTNLGLRDPAELGQRLLQALASLDRSILSMLDYTAVRSELPEPVAVSVHTTARQIAGEVSRRFELDPAVIAVDIPSDLIASASSFHLGKVIDQILTNAAQSRSDSRPLAIELSGAMISGRVRIRVVDNGVGVPSVARERVFQPMERLTGQQTGSGLGLAIARRIVGGFDGSIWIEPDQTQGTAVSIDLPAG